MLEAVRLGMIGQRQGGKTVATAQDNEAVYDSSAAVGLCLDMK